jgi:tripartite-type tricarboxylate transporter receptor subunit TctC
VLERDFIPLAMIARPPQVVVSHPTRVQAKTLAELIAFARANPNKLNYGSAGSGTTHHMIGELFKLATGTQLQHVPYRGAGPALQDLVAGQIDLMFDGLGSSAPQIQSGTLRGLAVAAAKRSPAIPDVPTTAEAGLPDFEASTWYGVWAIKGTPDAARQGMLNGIRKVMATSTTADTWARNGSDVPNIEGDAFARHIAADIARWATVVRNANVVL